MLGVRKIQKRILNLIKALILKRVAYMEKFSYNSV